MRAARITSPGGPEVLSIVELPDLAIAAPGQALIEVAAAGLNRADLLQRRGFYPAPPGFPSDVPGLEYSGRVIASSGALAIGDRVMGITGGGAMSTQLVANEGEVIR